jgi:uncharacterized protein with PhoU and TrkA domain
MIDVSQLVERVAKFTADATAEFDLDYPVTETETLRFDRPDALVVDGENGDVTIQSAERDDVAVEVTRRAESQADIERIGVESSGGGDSPLRLAVVREDDIDGAVDLAITVPEGVPVERVVTVNGQIDAEGVTVAAVETTNGSVTVTDATGDLRVETTNGSVTVERVDGFVDASTTNGSVTVRDAAGVDGIETKAGSIDAEVAAIRADTTIQSRVGSVEILAAAGLDADVSLKTNLGSIAAPVFDTDASGVGKVTTGGTVGDGGDRLRVETRAGKIEFDIATAGER